MFEIAEVGNAVSKKEYIRRAKEVRAALIDAQRRLAASDKALIIIVSGVEGAGKEEVVDLLHEWMDSRGIETYAMWDQTDEERDRPPMWRFWRALPPKGRIAIFFGSWYTTPIIDCVFGRIDDLELERRMHRVCAFEQMLRNENVVVLKFWMHLAKDAQKRRLKALKRDKRTRWRINELTWKFFNSYDAFRRVSEVALRRTDSDFAPWHIVEATDDFYRDLKVTETLVTRIDRALGERTRPDPTRSSVPVSPTADGLNVIRSLDLSLALPKDEYKKKLGRYQGRLAKLARRLHEAGRSMIVVLEGPDAAGKGGSIRSITSAVDSRLYRVMPVAAPTDEEAAHPYLWRFWRNIPRCGYITIYDRSWYGRVLVERIEGFCGPEQWGRAYGEINEFEQQLVEAGTIVVKFWLAISPKEQLARFENRELTPYKQYKLTEEDWRNRAKWDAYEMAACDMIARTSPDYAPWILVEAEDRYWARIKVLRTVTSRIRRALNS
jgi:AMP-polyphosphate phosphotransferase